MKKIYHLLLVLVLYLNLSLPNAYAQNYPISGYGAFMTPSSLTWSSLYNTQALNLTLVAKDIGSTPGEIFARIRLSRVGIEIANPQSFVATKGIKVNFGSPLQLSGIDFAENFNYQNLDASGVPESLFTQGGVLPNGFWTIELTFFELDAARNHRQVSDKISIAFTVNNGQAPLLNLPSNESEIDARYGQNFSFAWTPRGTSLSGAGGLTYNFSLWELGEDENPYDVAEGKTPIYTSSVSVPMLVYDPTKPLLQVGKHYAWQVQVVDPFGNNVYENNGKSEIWEFRYGLKCQAPALNFKSIGSGYTEIYWDKINQAQNYDLRWRIQGTNEYSHYITSWTYHRLEFDREQVYDVEIQSQCYGGEYSDWKSSKYPENTTPMLKSMTPAAPVVVYTREEAINPADIPVNGADVDPTVYDNLVNTLNAEPKSEIRCGKVNQTAVFACQPDDVSDYQGTKDFTSKPNSTFYVNGYDVRITKVVNQTSGEGLLYMPLFGQRIPVVWSGITLKEGEGKDYMGNAYGCLTSGEVIVAGSNPNLIVGDLNTQYQALYNSLNSPGSYSGTFGQAVSDMGLIAQELLDKIAKGTPIEPSDYQKYNSVCNAVKKGMDDWKKKLVDKYGDNPKFPEFQRLYSSIDNIKTSLLNEIDCDRQGKVWNRNTDDSEVLYASIGMPYLEDFYLKNPCKIALTQSKSSELKDLLSTAVDLEKQPLDANLTDKPTTSPDLPTALSLLTQLQLTTSYAQGHGCEDYKFVDFKEGCMYSSGSSLTPAITYFGKPTIWKTPLPLWLVNNVWVCQSSDTPLAFKYYNSSDLKWYDLPLPAGETAGEAFANVFAQGFAVLLSAGVGLGAQTAVVAEQTAQRCIINGSIDLVIQGILYGGWEAYQQGKLPKEVLPSIWDRISLISVAGS
ncbi:hypothetical protein, partial [Cellulophaga sp. BC115SP]|uniref:hypothetical protein n=1 Tax=Cellulophaga sp. BC115SP TaxID=2683263 RepID=UPI001411C8BD